MRNLLPYAWRSKEPIRHSTPRASLGITLGLALSVASGFCVNAAEAKPIARVLPSGDGIELIGAPGSGTYLEPLPLYRSGGMRYFSAGVGLEERDVDYPPFPLKLILVAGGGAYLSIVAVTITNDDGTLRLDIPKEHVNGPWIFIDLPPGSYQVTARRDGDTVEKKSVKVTEGAVRTVYLRWP